jgi:hypothetical protein
MENEVLLRYNNLTKDTGEKYLPRLRPALQSSALPSPGCGRVPPVARNNGRPHPALSHREREKI